MGVATVPWLVDGRRVHVKWGWPPVHIGGSPTAGGGYRGRADSVLVCGIRHIRSHAPVREVLQVRHLTGVWLVL